MPTKKEFDVVIWGATGFTGRLVAEHLSRRLSPEPGKRWAIAGRDEAKLRQLREQIGEPELAMIVADARDIDQMQDLAGRTKAIATTVGPYSQYGNELVAACASVGTHYCDLAGEVPWVKRMIEAHQMAATASGAKIVSCCGFDSIPSDLGAYYLQQQAGEIFDAPAQRIHMLVRKIGGSASGGTVASMLEIAQEAQKSARTRRILMDPYALSPMGHRGEDRNESLGFSREELSGEWIAPFIMAGINTRIVRRSAALLADHYGPKFSYAEYIGTGVGLAGAAKAAAISAATTSMVISAAIPPTRALLRQLLPSPGEGPDADARERGQFALEFHGMTEHGDAITVRVTGDQDPGYGATSRMLGEAVMALSKLPRRKGQGGFLTPATALGDPLIKRLEAHAGMQFSTATHSPAATR